MKIGLVVPGFSRNSDDWAIPALQTLACRLAQVHELHVFSLRYPAAGRYHLCGQTHHATGGGTRSGLYSLAVIGRTIRALLAEHRRAPFDVFHAFWVDEPAFVAGLVGKLLRRPVVASLGGGELVHLPALGYGTWASPWRRWLIRLALRQATLVTAGSPLARDLCLKRGVPAKKVTLAPLGVDLERFRPGPPPDRHRPVIVQAASLTPVKNQMLLLAIAARVRARYPALRVLVAGAGHQEALLREEAERLGLDQTVAWQGAVPYPRMPTFYQGGHLYLQTSCHESQGMAVLEAMACGLPVLGTPVGLLPEVAAMPASGAAGRLAEQALALLSEPEALAEQSQAARHLVEDLYSLERAAARFLSLYQACRNA